MDTITNLSDLCEYFEAESPRLLNGKIYDDTECGASISIHVGNNRQVSNVYTLCFKQGTRFPVLESVRKGGQFCDPNVVHVDVKHLFHLRWNGDHELECEMFPTLALFKSACKKFMGSQKIVNREHDFVEIQSVIGNSVTVLHSHFHDASRWFHPGEKWPVTKKTNLLGFILRTNIDGSDVTVASEEFVVPVETARVSEWMKEMEKQADFYWNRDNLDHWRLLDPDGQEYFFETGGWDEPEWHEEERKVPDMVKKRVIAWIDKRFGESFCWFDQGDEFKFGCKGWTVSQYQDDSEY